MGDEGGVIPITPFDVVKTNQRKLARHGCGHWFFIDAAESNCDRLKPHYSVAPQEPAAHTVGIRADRLTAGLFMIFEVMTLYTLLFLILQCNTVRRITPTTRL